MIWRLLVCALIGAVTNSLGQAATYDEATSSDLSGVPSAPTAFPLDAGANTLSGGASSDDIDLVHFTIPTGSSLTSLTLDEYQNDLSSVSFVGLEVGSTWSAGLFFSIDPSYLIGASHLGAGDAGIGDDLLIPLSRPGAASGFELPLAAGDYVLLIQDTDNPIDYAMTFNVSAPSMPGDFNGDRLVNGDDLEEWTTYFGDDDAADADDDSDSDGADFLIWQRAVGSPGISPVPEPSSFAIAATCLAGVALILGVGGATLARRCNTPA